MKKTELKEVGLAYCKTTLDPLGTTISAFLYEHHSGHDGDVMKDSFDMTFDTVGDSENPITGTATRSYGITATWLPLGSNRFTAPTLHVGERVQIFRESDTGLYRWRPLGLDESLRRKETIIFGISACKDGMGRDKDNMYWFELSSHSQKIALSTNTNLGEKTNYNFYFDLAEGVVCLEDGVGNVIRLDSTERIIHLKTADGATHTLNKKDIDSYAPGHITMKAGKSVSVEAGTELNWKAGTVTNWVSPQVRGRR